jgi:hypothetical protein
VSTHLGILFAALIGLLLVLRSVRWLLWRRLSSRNDRPVRYDFTLAELHALHRTGKLSTEEFERVREAVLRREAAQQAAAAPPDGGRGFEVLPGGPRQPPNRPT